MSTAVNDMNNPIETVVKILVMEDSSVQGQVVRELLESHGFQVKVAHDGPEGLRLLHASSFDLVFSDVMMPHMSGYEVCRQIKSDEALKQIPVVLITRLRDPWDIVEGLQCGADSFVTKPYEPEYLIDRLRSILATKVIQDETKLAVGVEIKLLGKTLKITPEKQQIFGLLVSTIEEFVRTRNREQESQRVQRILLESQKTLQSTLDGMSSGITVIDQSGRIVATNAAWRLNDWSNSLFNNSGEIRINYLEMCRSAMGEQRQSLMAVGESIHQILSGARNQIEEEVCCGTGKDQKWVSIKATRIESDGRGAVVITHDDISSRKRAEESLRISQEQLRQAQKMEAVGRLAGGVAHDFNNMLCVILGYSELLMGDLSPNHPMFTAIQAIHEASSRSAALTKQLLLFSRKLTISQQTLDLNNVISQIEKLLRRLLGENIELVTILDPAPAIICGDVGHVEQVIMNLAINARDAMPDGGRLVIKVARTEAEEDTPGAHATEGGRVILSVSDTGCGMDQDTKERIFEPFFTTKAPGHGTGLGLATVFSVVQQCGGEITVATEPDCGTTFQIIWREAEHELNQSIQPKTLLASVAKGRETILLVEDEAAIRKLFRGVLERNGYVVLEAGDGEEAVRLAREYNGTIDLLITDMVMPKLGGREVAQEMAKLRPTTKVLFCSGYDPAKTGQESLVNSATNVLQKPLEINEFLRTIDALLNPAPPTATIPLQWMVSPPEAVEII